MKDDVSPHSFCSFTLPLLVIPRGIMGVYEARGQLSKALKDLMLRWNEAKMDWDDAAARAFENSVLEPLQRDAKNAASAMDSAAETLQQVRRECE